MSPASSPLYAFLIGALKLIGAESHDDLSPSTSLVRLGSQLPPAHPTTCRICCSKSFVPIGIALRPLAGIVVGNIMF
jgi:hypothetical protein